MKVTHIFWSLGFGGIETMLVNIANAQAEAGSEVSVLIINELYVQSLVNSLDKRVKIVFFIKHPLFVDNDVIIALKNSSSTFFIQKNLCCFFDFLCNFLKMIFLQIGAFFCKAPTRNN